MSQELEKYVDRRDSDLAEPLRREIVQAMLKTHDKARAELQGKNGRFE